MTGSIGKCLYCGEPKQLYVSTLDKEHLFVKCQTCGAQGPDSRDETNAVALWNAASNVARELEAERDNAIRERNKARELAQKLEKQPSPFESQQLETNASNTKYKQTANDENDICYACSGTGEGISGTDCPLCDGTGEAPK